MAKRIPRSAAAKAGSAPKPSKRKTVAPAAKSKSAKIKPRERTSSATTAITKWPRRAIFIDIENTSNEQTLSRVIESLAIDPAKQRTELFAFGNWRAIGQPMSRMLARLGAALVHTSPVTGVKDWSDLWIAVAAGRWIALASPGDILEIISNDKAFEAVGDAAAGAGIVFHRVPHRHATTSTLGSEAGRETKRRRSRGGQARRRVPTRPPHSASSGEMKARSAQSRKDDASSGLAPQRRQEDAHDRQAAAPTETISPDADLHGASHDRVLATIRRLTNGDPSRWINLDAIANALKAEGFTRPPGSVRLVVRLRRMKDVEVLSNGMVRLLG